jgi:hypothetical protein
MPPVRFGLRARMSYSSGSLPELIEKAPPRSLRQILGTALLWSAVAAAAGIAVALALVVAPGRDDGTAAAQDRTAAALAVSIAPAAMARDNEPLTKPAPPAAQTAVVSRDTDRAAERRTDRLAAVHDNPQPPRQHRRAGARGYRDRFQPFGHSFAWSSSRNRWR